MFQRFFNSLFTHNWSENNWIRTFAKGINAMWNAIWTRVTVSISYDDN